jgi:hypothetical protein
MRKRALLALDSLEATAELSYFVPDLIAAPSCAEPLERSHSCSSCTEPHGASHPRNRRRRPARRPRAGKSGASDHRFFTVKRCAWETSPRGGSATELNETVQANAEEVRPRAAFISVQSNKYYFFPPIHSNCETFSHLVKPGIPQTECC